MSIINDILRTYRAPRGVQALRMANGPREDRALAVLMGACFLIFIAQLPRLSRETYLDASVPFDGRMAGALFAWCMIMPLVFYGLALLVHAALRMARAGVTGFMVRMALFWALLASTPLWLLAGLMAGFAGPVGANLTGAAALGAFVIFSIFGLVDAVRKGQEPQP